MSIFTEISMIVLALIAAATGVIGMIASITELVITRNQTRQNSKRREE